MDPTGMRSYRGQPWLLMSFQDLLERGRSTETRSTRACSPRSCARGKPDDDVPT
ncbi:MAG: hypothetical protein MZV70_73440 [Desulfobacterales bacterium]|nr:hypothetical protein [Desulfobacterales bacterium]